MKYNSYPNYKLHPRCYSGGIPIEWEFWKLTHAIKVIGSGTTPKSDNTEYYDGEILWVTTSELREKIILDTHDKLTEIALKHNSSLKYYNIGAVVIAMYGATIGRLGILGNRATVNQACCVFDKLIKFDNKFLYYWFRMMRPIIISLSYGGGQPNLSQDLLKQLIAPTPSIDEQQTIAKFLDYKTAQIDSLIEKKEELLKLLEEKRIALITNAVTGKIIPPGGGGSTGGPEVPVAGIGIDVGMGIGIGIGMGVGVASDTSVVGDVVAESVAAAAEVTATKEIKYKPSGIPWLGEIPEDWYVCQLKYVAAISYGIGGEIDKSITEGVRLLSLPNVSKEGDLLLEEEYYIELKEDERESLLLKGGDLLFNWRNGSSDHLGKTVIINKSDEYTHVSFLLRIRFKKKFDSRYFKYLLNGYRMTRYFSSSKAGVNNTFNLSELSELSIIVPTKTDQKNISDFLDLEIDKILKLRSTIINAIEKLKEYRTSLITSAVTGKIDLRNWQHPATDAQGVN